MKFQIIEIFRFITVIIALSIKQIQNITFMDIFYFVMPILMILWIITYRAIEKPPYFDSQLYHVLNLGLALLVLIGYIFYIIFSICNKNFHLIPISLLIANKWCKFLSCSLQRYKDFVLKRKSSNFDTKASL